MKKSIILLLLVAFVQALPAQETYRQINNALRYIKVGNTLREAQQYDLSEKYLRLGLQNITAIGNRYWEAAAYENLGLLFKDQDKSLEAARYFNKALVIYRQLKMGLSEKALEQMLGGAEGKEQSFAGIEIGNRGVKLSVVSIVMNSSGEVEYVLKTDTATNPEPAALTQQSQIETAETIRKFMDIAKNTYKIPADKIYVVVASGLKTELDKKDKVKEFVAAITPPNASGSFSVRFVTPQEEGELAVLGTVPPKRRFTTSLIDVGSGNTKGGYFMDMSQSFDPLYFSTGTRTFVKMIKSKNPGGISEFVKTAEQMWRDSLSQAVKDELGRRAGLRNRSAVYLSGGIVWCIASYFYPEKVNENYIELTAEDIRRFRVMVVNNFEKLIQPDLSNITNDHILLESRKNLSRVQNTYDQESLIAGTIWLDGLVRELNATQPVKRFYYPKYAYVGWISGYIARAVAEEYRKKNEDTAAGR